MQDDEINPEQIDEVRWEIPKEKGMNVPAKIFASEKIMRFMKKDKTLQQVKNVAYLPGIYKNSIVMPDGHQGYGFPIGGVAAFDAEKGCISPGGIGYDINCGVRLLQTSLKKEDLKDKLRPLISLLFKNCPVGLGVSNINVDYDQLDIILKDGAGWAVENGYGTEDDLKHCEEEGCMAEAEPGFVSQQAKKRGKKQLATVGSGNHFVEVQYVDKIFDRQAAEAFGIKEEGQVCILIHCGSRGLGHQTCSDYLREMEQAYPEIIESLPDRELVYAPAGSEVAKRYLGAMAAAANFAWCNRHMLGHFARQAVKELFPEAEVKTVYDVAHNIAKVEEHDIDGKKVKVYVHRKGATRAFPKGMREVPEAYRDVGQPVIIPGSMGTSSWLLVGAEQSMKESFGSTAHGAGRMMSRSRAIHSFKGEDIVKGLEEKGIIVKATSWKGIAEEAPEAYKDVDDVIETTHKAGIARKVAQLKPMGVVKG